MVEQRKRFKSKTANARQETYAATICAVAGGTLMYTAWQFMVPTELEMPTMSLLLKFSLILGSLVCVTIGYNIYTEENK
jgi:uncharacterized membrane protein